MKYKCKNINTRNIDAINILQGNITVHVQRNNYLSKIFAKIIVQLNILFLSLNAV